MKLEIADVGVVMTASTEQRRTTARTRKGKERKGNSKKGKKGECYIQHGKERGRRLPATALTALSREIQRKERPNNQKEGWR